MDDGVEDEQEGPAAPAEAPPVAPGTQPEAKPKEEATPAATAEPYAAEAAFVMEMLQLVDAANGFNNGSKFSMLWTVQHRCPRLATYALNCYRHAKRLIVRDPGGEPIIILSEEGVTQGDPLAMVLYGMMLLPLAEILREAYPEVLQPWYANDAAMQGPPDQVAACFKLLCEIGPLELIV